MAKASLCHQLLALEFKDVLTCEMANECYKVFSQTELLEKKSRFSVCFCIVRFVRPQTCVVKIQKRPRRERLLTRLFFLSLHYFD